jgi:hypothetical protein
MTFDAVGAAWFGLDISVRALAAAAAVALVLRLLRVRGAAVLHSGWSTHACDEAAARAIAAPGRYAEILVEMADVVRRHRGRLTWQAVGVNGAGLLDSRIDRLLRGDALASTSRGRKLAAGIGCVLAIATVVACRQQISARRCAKIRSWRNDSRKAPSKREGSRPPAI